MATTAYLMWYDDNPKVAVVKKIEAAVDAYARRFQIAPNVVLVNEADVVADQVGHQGVNVQGAPFVRRNNFWVGYQRDMEQ